MKSNILQFFTNSIGIGATGPILQIGVNDGTEPGPGPNATFIFTPQSSVIRFLPAYFWIGGGHAGDETQVTTFSFEGPNATIESGGGSFSSTGVNDLTIAVTSPGVTKIQSSVQIGKTIDPSTSLTFVSENATIQTSSFAATGASDLTIITSSNIDARLRVSTGNSSGRATVGGTLDHSETTKTLNNGGTPISGTEYDLHSYTVPLSTLAFDGHAIHVICAGTAVNTGLLQTMIIRLLWGSNAIYTSEMITFTTGESWNLNSYITRDSSTSLRCITTVTSTLLAVFDTQYISLAGLNFDIENILKIVGTTTGASPTTNDITSKIWRVKWE